jgi:hypothetical protein
MERFEPFDLTDKVFDLLLQLVFADAFLPLIVHQLPIFKAKIIDKTARTKPLSEDLFLRPCRFEFEAICLHDGHCAKIQKIELISTYTDDDCAISRRALPSKPERNAQCRPRPLEVAIVVLIPRLKHVGFPALIIVNQVIYYGSRSAL